MTARETELKGMGVVVGGAYGDVANVGARDLLAESSFSGYGAYTPITVRPYSMPKNANVERDK